VRGKGVGLVGGQRGRFGGKERGWARVVGAKVQCLQDVERDLQAAMGRKVRRR